MASNGKKVVVAMSGGVDSSVAAALLKEQGFEVLGVFLRLGSPKGVELTEHNGRKQGCCSVLDAADARRVAQLLEIPFYVLNFENEFSRIVEYFAAEYNRGRTPNPCVRCNDWLKFGRLTQYAQAVGADYLATGHYARVGVDPVSGDKTLMRGRDRAKDQSYVLFGMSRETLARAIFPVGDMEKSQVRQIAKDRSLPVFDKPDSQEICFVPDQDYAGLLRRRDPDSMREGELVSTDGQTLGLHDGHQQFTIGQRKGLGIAKGRRLYVLNIDSQSNRVVLGDREELLKSTLVADGVNLLSDRLQPGGDALRCLARIRHNHQPAAARAELTAEGNLRVRFDEAQSAITPGQAVVIYEEDVVVGGGWIDRAE